MIDSPVLPDGHALAERYEALRHDVLDGCGGGGRTLSGRALLMFKGMAAWIKAIGEVPVRTVCSSVAADQRRVPVSLKYDVVNIVATMAWATTLEGQA